MEEQFGLTWPGRRAAIDAAHTPVRAHLVDPHGRKTTDLSGNLVIEGDNLDALKLLSLSLSGQVNLIYIDPPYNTGSDFVYDDSFTLTRAEYRARIGQQATKDVQEEGRQHSAWLSMMLPRILLAHQLLSNDGVLLISVDRNESAHLKILCQEIFGARNLIGEFVWVSNPKGRQIVARGPAATHETLLCLAKDASQLSRFTADLESLKDLMPCVYKGARYPIEHDEYGPYVRKNELYNTNSRFNETTAPTMVYRIHYHPDSGQVKVSDIDDPTTFPGFVTAMPHPNARPGIRWHAWRWSRTRVLNRTHDLDFRLVHGKLKIWTKVRDVSNTLLKDIIIGPSTLTGKTELKELGLSEVFETPKPRVLLELLIRTIAPKDALVLDFFSGSATTGAAVMALNSEDGGTRRFILVQKAEKVPPKSAAARAGFSDIAQIGRERLRREQIRLSRIYGHVIEEQNDESFRELRILTHDLEHT